MQYFCKRIVWTLLTIVTFGIYGFWLQIKSVKWTISHTNLLNMPDDIKSIETKVISIIDKESGPLQEIVVGCAIKKEAFYQRKTFEEVIIPDGVTFIGDRAFGFCSSMTKVYIPLSVTHIGDMAFDGCGKVKIYCACNKKPDGWSSTWNICNYPVEWGYKGD